MKSSVNTHCFLLLIVLTLSPLAHAQEMDTLWGESTVKLRAEDAERGQLFDAGNYAMFIHWGLYSNLANKVDGKTYYSIRGQRKRSGSVAIILGIKLDEPGNGRGLIHLFLRQ